MNSESLTKKTLVTVAAMVSACVLIVGTMTLIAVFVVGRVVSPPQVGAENAAAAVEKSGKTDLATGTKAAPGRPAKPKFETNDDT